MPMIGRTDDQRVNVISVQYPLKLDVIVCSVGELGLRLQAMRLINITNSNDFVAAKFVENTEQILATLASANRADTDSIIGSKDLSVRCCTYGGSGQKSTSAWK